MPTATKLHQQMANMAHILEETEQAEKEEARKVVEVEETIKDD
jgi:hypothetical protein